MLTPDVADADPSSRDAFISESIACGRWTIDDLPCAGVQLSVTSARARQCRGLKSTSTIAAWLRHAPGWPVARVSQALVAERPPSADVDFGPRTQVAATQDHDRLPRSPARGACS